MSDSHSKPITPATTLGPAVNVLQIVTDRDRRGAQVYAMDLADGLRQLGLDVETVALSEGRHGDLLPIETLGPSRYSWRTIRSLRKRARDHDVVVAHGSSTLAACAVGLAFTKIPFVYRQISDPLFWAPDWPRRLRVAALLRRAAGIVSLSRGTSDVLCKHYWLASDRISVIPNAVPIGGFRASSLDEQAAARERFDLQPQDFVIAYVGAHAEEKGVDFVVRCAGEIAEARALIAGDGPEHQRLEELAADLAPGRVRFPGPIEDAGAAYAAADVVVLPSKGGDSMPAVLIEAGLCALPAVVTPVGAITDVVVDGQTGTVVPVGDLDAFCTAVRELMDDRERRTSLGQAAAEHCREHFTIEATAPAWRQLFQQL